MDFSDNYNRLVSLTADLSKYSDVELENLLHKANDIYNEYDNLQLIVKRNANSLYGTSASIYNSLVDFDVAEDITMTGKMFTVAVDRSINKFLVNWSEAELIVIKQFYPDIVRLRKFTEYKQDTVNDVCVYGDTDSRYIDLEFIYTLLIKADDKPMLLPDDNKELSDFALFLVNNFFNKIIDDTINEICEYRNARKGYLKMTHEVTTNTCVFIKKKKYILSVIYDKGKFLSKPKLKFKGIELKRGSSAPRAKKILTILLNKYLLDNFSIDMLRLELLKIIQYIKQAKNRELIYQITSVSGLKNISKVNGKFVSNKHHIQMQIALSWMNFIEQGNSDSKKNYKPPFEGQKMNWYYTLNPNFPVIGVPDDVNIMTVPNLPEPDYNRMIEMSITKPFLRYIIDKPEINPEDISNFLLGAVQLKF